MPTNSDGGEVDDRQAMDAAMVAIALDPESDPKVRVAAYTAWSKNRQPPDRQRDEEAGDESGGEAMVYKLPG